jgi:hypothetical protein
MKKRATMRVKDQERDGQIEKKTQHGKKSDKREREKESRRGERDVERLFLNRKIQTDVHTQTDRESRNRFD